MINHAQIIGALCKPKERALLNQMFTAENFRRIFDKENRKGHDIVDRFFSDVKEKTSDIRDKFSEIRDLRKRERQMPPSDFTARKEELESEFYTLKKEKSDLINTEMENLSNDIFSSNFKLELTKKDGPKGKPVYCIDEESAKAFFIVKQLQQNIHRLYKIKPSNRHDLACQLRDALDSKFPFELVRTDISEFYETIDRKLLYTKLDEDQLLSSSSKKFIRQIFASYAEASGKHNEGIPRGVGISAYLAELSLRPVDRDISNLPGNILYCRFVDDIVAVFAKSPTDNESKTYKERIIEIIKGHGLKHNEGKTFDIDFRDNNGQNKFEYLGYEFIKTNGALEIAPSDAKVKKLELRMEAAFKAYNRTAPTKPRKAFRELVARIKFLTGNTRLKHKKSNATTGIYYNNLLVTDASKFQYLDGQLRQHVKAIRRPNLRKQLRKYGFKAGFDDRRFHNFSANELKIIVKVWKYVS